MITRKYIPRRAFLRGLGGVAVGLPFLDAMAPALASSSIPGGAPRRMAWVYVPNGMLMRDWLPAERGPLGEMPRTLKPMEPLKDDLLLLGNLTQNNGRPLLDGSGDHGRCCGSYLTGVHVNKSEADVHAGVSSDQLIANQIGQATRFSSLQIGLEDARQAGACDTGYSCAYTNNLSWKSETQPLPPVLNPRDLFERLFGTDAHLSARDRELKSKFRQSVLDLVMEDTKRLQGKLGPTDNRKMDEYMTSIREVEQQLDRTENSAADVNPGFDKPYGVPADFAEHYKLMADMMTIAFRADLSRVFTFLVCREGSLRPYRELGISDGHHPLTHHRNNPELMEKVAQINLYHTMQFARWMQELKSIEEGDSNILDNSTIVYGAGLSDGNRHLHDNLPTMVVGRGGDKKARRGQYVVYRKETPITNLYVSMMQSAGVQADSFADSTGPLQGIDLGGAVS